MRTCTWSLPAQPSSVSELRTRVAEYAARQDVVDPPLEGLRLAVSEAVTNAVVHAYRDQAPGVVTASIDIDRPASRIVVHVTDDGQGLGPRPDSPGLGLGLPLIASVADETTLLPGPGGIGTDVCMRFAI